MKWVSYYIVVLIMATSCLVIKNPPRPKPFVFKTDIKVTGKVSSSEKRLLKEALENQIDDSLKVRKVYTIGLVAYFIPTIEKRVTRPPAFDTLNISRSRIFMRALLNSRGYFYPQIRDTFHIDSVKGQYRVSINFIVEPGKQVHIDSIGYALETPALQQLAMQNRERSDLKKYGPYSIQVVSDELERLVTLYRNNGYYKLSREDLFAEVDTVAAALIDPTLDPFEQIRLLDSLQKQRENPTIRVVIKQRPLKDSAHILQFHIGDVTVYPDMPALEDTLGLKKDSATLSGFKFYKYTNLFKLPFVARNITIRPGSLYTQRRYFRTINNFNALPAWSNVDLTLAERYDSVPLLDATLKLYPARKLSASLDFETSRNVSDFLTTGQLFGLGLNLRLLNRNAFREGIQSSTNARFGIELGTHLVQTLQASLSHTINIPKGLITERYFKKRFGEDKFTNYKTLINLNASYTDRRDFFSVQSVNLSIGDEFTLRRRRDDQDNPGSAPGRRWRYTFQIIPFNFEYTSVYKTDSLEKLEAIIPSLKFAFNDGLIMSFPILSMTTGGENGNKFTLLRAKFENSGLPWGLYKRLELGDLRSFIKFDVEWKHYISYKKSSWAFRGYGGFSYIYGKVDTNGTIGKETRLPFFKAFVAGGPYSMRAWPIRMLGPGSSSLYDTPTVIDRFGNMQIELNAEYRYTLATIAGIKVNSALFVDIGNIWSKETDKNNNPIPEASFKLDRLYKDIAIGGGTSLRFDFDIFLIRLDWAYKLKNPLYANENAGWFHKLQIDDGQFQLGIGYPF